MPADAAPGAAASHEVPEARRRAGPAAAQIVHRTRERWRLRVPERRYDLAYFISLYEALRKQPEIREVTVNPATASALVWFSERDVDHLHEALTRDGLLSLPSPSMPPDSGAEPLQAAAGRVVSAEMPGDHDDPDAQHPSVHHAFHMSVNDTRILVFLIMLGLSVYQLSKKQFLAPALTIALYVIELLAGLRLERDAAVRVHQRVTDASPTDRDYPEDRDIST
ncbi:MAG: hypothetical protein GVY22_12140 [Gammaproteobacteria bacterium]|jgi:hypothetical protein|nr:hypothetical protein [Gammaproteobacteria bacterium]